MNCPLCETLLRDKIDAFYFHCDQCKALVKDSMYYISIEDEKSRYQSHNNDVDDVRYQNFTSPITNKIFEKFSPDDLGLDYGCGTGPVISKMLEKQNYQVKLYDPYFFPDLQFLNFQYDYIFSCEVFEHFYHPKLEISKLVGLLKPKGMLLVITHLYDETIPFQNWYYRKDPTHVFIFTQETIEYISKTFDLKIIEQTNRYVFFEKN